MSVKQVIKAIKNYSKFLVTSHVNAEGDAIGSELALVSLLRKLGKEAYIVNGEKTPANYMFLPGAKMIRQNLPKCDFDAAFIVDCPVMQRIGPITKLVNMHKPIITIDHHVDNTRFGYINWIDPKASSAGEMIYRLFDLIGVTLDKKDALNIYTAILTDTGSFRHANTTSAVFAIARELLKLGVEPAQMYTKIYENNSVQDVAVVAEIISKMKFSLRNKIAWAEIKKDKSKRLEGKTELVDKILDFGKSVRSVKVVALFYQIDNRTVKVSLRSKAPINVQRIAKFFGGGGHVCASGCRVKGNFKEVERKVLQQVKRTLR